MHWGPILQLQASCHNELVIMRTCSTVALQGGSAKKHMHENCLPASLHVHAQLQVVKLAEHYIMRNTFTHIYVIYYTYESSVFLD